MKQMLRMAAVCIGLLLVIALPVSATEYGAPEITPKTTMKQLRENPSIKGSGLYTYVYIWERDCDLLRHSKDNDTMEQVIGTESVNSCVAGMNYLIETYNAGTQITYKLFSPEEIAQDASRDRAELYYFPAEQPGAKYAVVLSGNALFYSGEMRGGVSTAWELHQQGYAVFALRYRIGLDATDNAPLEDLGRAIQFITANAQQFGVQTEDYALVGYSSQASLAAKSWATRTTACRSPVHCCWRTPSTIFMRRSRSTMFCWIQMRWNGGTTITTFPTAWMRITRPLTSGMVRTISC